MSAFYIIALCLVSGLVLQRVKSWPDNAAQVLNQYVIWIALPALILHHVPKLSLDASVLLPMATAWGILLVSAGLVLGVVKLCRWSSETRTALLLLVPLGNTSFVGIPLVSALVGEEAIVYAILYDQLGSFLALATYGSFVLAMRNGDRLSIKSVVGKVITFPPFIALCFALLINILSVSSPLESAFSLIGQTLVPVVMVAVGLQWRFVLPKDEVIMVTAGLSIKLLLAPLLLLAIFSFVDIPSVLRTTLLLESAMAPMISAGAMLIGQQIAPRLTSALVGYGLLFGLITVPLWAFMIQ